MSEIEPIMNMNLISSSSSCLFDEQRWLIQIRKTLDEQVLEEEIDIQACIFNVPKKLLATDPYSYIPQHVALGPYHYWRSELYEMQRHKLAAAKRTQKQLPQDSKFQHFVDELAKLEPRIRRCYHKYLDYNGETLAWMMAVDAAFLLEFIQTPVGRNSAHEAILRDLVMLENQIPMFLLSKLLEFLQFSPAPESADKKLFSMLMGLCKEISPLRRWKNFQIPNLANTRTNWNFCTTLSCPNYTILERSGLKLMINKVKPKRAKKKNKAANLSGIQIGLNNCLLNSVK
ncbi:putative UPF0481 protein At3g02645 [Diospyros lotus]|uniref:putative UPF0481 protein At3g02645 n=1 Tax=Diospyros lotus TaxID=55363 RepID=UPI00224D82F6|nr:putative UPF0481 protein At3g02645 [Diospyros lotus]